MNQPEAIRILKAELEATPGIFEFLEGADSLNVVCLHGKWVENQGKRLAKETPTSATLRNCLGGLLKAANAEISDRWVQQSGHPSGEIPSPLETLVGEYRKGTRGRGDAFRLARGGFEAGLREVLEAWIEEQPIPREMPSIKWLGKGVFSVFCCSETPGMMTAIEVEQVVFAKMAGKLSPQLCYAWAKPGLPYTRAVRPGEASGTWVWGEDWSFAQGVGGTEGEPICGSGRVHAFWVQAWDSPLGWSDNDIKRPPALRAFFEKETGVAGGADLSRHKSGQAKSASIEARKDRAWKLYRNGESLNLRTEGLREVMRCHYERLAVAPKTFEEYAPHWLWAQWGAYDETVMLALSKIYPLPMCPRIQWGYTMWDSVGKMPPSRGSTPPPRELCRA